MAYDSSDRLVSVSLDVAVARQNGLCYLASGSVEKAQKAQIQNRFNIQSEQIQTRCSIQSRQPDLGRLSAACLPGGPSPDVADGPGRKADRRADRTWTPEGPPDLRPISLAAVTPTGRQLVTCNFSITNLLTY